ncbi:MULTISPECIES: cupin domain-containing protein [unclassified Streptomyces]|uniref:cupin domain-containing protein n=1 Tax=unclassified Streptomyces TaxID=2593676 RepID=UPI003669C7D7
MAGPPSAGVLAGLANLIDVPADQGGAVWRLSTAGRQLDANLIRVLPGDRVEGHVEPDLDVLVCVLTGTGELETDGRRQKLVAGCVVWLPRGTYRSLSAGPVGLAFVTAHRRRPGLAIRNAASSAATAPAAVEGGEPACVLHRVCPGCDRPAEDVGARYCSRCGTELPS